MTNRFVVIEEMECDSCHGTGKRRAGTMDCSDHNNIWPGMTIPCGACAGAGKVQKEVSLEYAIRELAKIGELRI